MLNTNLKTVLDQHPLGLVFDIDGTLSPIASRPEDARLYPGVAQNLARLHHYAHVAIMTGRAIEDGAAIVNVEQLTYIGTHGLEWSNGLPTPRTTQVVAEAEPYIEPGKYLLDIAEQQFGNEQGIVVQRKRVGGSIHYRLVSEPEQTRQRILHFLGEPAQRVHMRLEEGKRVIEVRVPLAINKGQALRRFTEQYELRGIIFAGDDRTDLDAVLEVVQARKQGLFGQAIVVRHSDTLPALLEHADIVVDEVEGMAALLQEIVVYLQHV